MKIIRLPKVKELTGLSRSSIYAMIKGRQFPRQVEISTRSVGWIEGDVQSWIASRVNKANAKERAAGGHNVSAF
ncbi:MAG: AlpA family transcriptional regulator [Bdellovibrionales bacterium]|jgi:prophage regulatory protein